jgi:hypothetical protein
MSQRLPHTIAVAVAVALALTLLACGLTAFAATARPGSQPWRFDSPIIGGHSYSLWMLPCDRFNPGQIILGHNLWMYSRYPPPGMSIPLAPACP